MGLKIVTPLIASLLTTFIAIPDAFADVNMMEASFQTTFVDLEIAGLKISRRYNSRSNINGVFGFGWCSTFDVKLAFANDGRTPAGISECGHRTKANIERTANGAYAQTLSTGLIRTFDATTGELAALQNGRGPEVAIERSGGSASPRGPARSRLPRDAALGEGLKMRLEFDDLNETVARIETSTGKLISFTYSPARDLLSARNAWGNTYRFDSDTLHNLTRISYPDGSSEKMTYDADHDRLLSFEGRGGNCKETYSHKYEISPAKLAQAAPVKLTQNSQAKLICQGRTKRVIAYDFTYEKHGARWSLANLKVDRQPAAASNPRGAQ